MQTSPANKILVFQVRELERLLGKIRLENEFLKKPWTIASSKPRKSKVHCPNTLDTDFCVEALEEAINRYGASDIFNTDQGAQFTSKSFTDLLKHNDIKISMDGRSRVQDNIFIERLWWTVKHHYLYLHTLDNGSQLRNGLNEWFRFYNQERSHQGLDNLTPDEVYYQLPHPFAEAA